MLNRLMYEQIYDVLVFSHVEIQPEDEDEVAEDVDGDEGDEDVSL